MCPSKWPPGRRYAPQGEPSCADCEHWHIDPDFLGTGLCFYTAKGAPARSPHTMETHTCDRHKTRRFTLVEQSIDGDLDFAGVLHE
jgi:hypothetical protein